MASPAVAGEQILFGPPPEWVVEASAPATNAPAPDLPVRVLVTDFQTRLEPDSTAHYIALEMQFLSPQGLSGGNISIDWRPEFDDVTVHHIKIARADGEFDVLEDGQTFNILRREQNLDAAMLNGVLTANMFPAGLEVGDTLRVAYTLKQSNPVLAGYPEATLGPLNGVVDFSHIRLSWPEDLPVQVVASEGLPPLERGSRRGYRHAQFTMGRQEPLLLPEGAPPRFQLVRFIEAGTRASWGDLSQSFVPLYDEAAKIPASGRLRDELEKIRAASEDPVRRAELALALVQDKVRYVALAMGVGGLVPTDAETTWARRFGDCKAKTAMLIGLLHELGIEAEPLLVNTVMGDALKERLPAVGAFDHVIVRARVAGREVFLDGTKTGETSLARLTVPGFTWGLPVLAAGADLVPMVPPPLTEPSEEFVVEIDASAGVRAPAPARLQAIFRGDGAVGLNNALGQMSGAARQQALEGFWRERYDFVTTDEVGTRFDPATGEMTLTLSGMAELDWSHNSYEPNGMRVGYEPDFSRTSSHNADAPYAVRHPLYFRTTHRITLPEGFTSSQVDGENVAQEVAGFEYRREVGIEGNLFTATRSTRSLAPEFAASEATEAEAMLKRLWEKRVFLHLPAGYSLGENEVATLAQARSEDASLLANQASALIDAAEWDAALGVLDKVLEISPGDDWALGSRALSRFYLGQLEGARADVEAALAANPANIPALNTSGMMAGKKADYATAIAAFTQVLASLPDDTFALNARMEAYVFTEQFDLALADARRVAEIEPGAVWAQAAESYVLMAAKRPEALQASIAAMLARAPDMPELLALASNLLLEAGLESESAALLARSMSGGPTALALFTSASRREVAETEKKLAELNQALQLEPDYVPALLLRADTLWAEYQLTRALADADRAIALAPDHLPAYMTRFKILADLERTTAAERMLDEMATRFAADANALAQTALFYQELNRLTKGRTLIEKAYALAPESEFVQHVQRSLTRR